MKKPQKLKTCHLGCIMNTLVLAYLFSKWEGKFAERLTSDKHMETQATALHEIYAVEMKRSRGAPSHRPLPWPAPSSPTRDRGAQGAPGCPDRRCRVTAANELPLPGRSGGRSSLTLPPTPRSHLRMLSA